MATKRELYFAQKEHIMLYSIYRVQAVERVLDIQNGATTEQLGSDMAKSFDPPDTWDPFGAFSQAVIAGDGKTIYLKGQVSLDRDGEVVGEGDMAAQVTQVLKNISDVLGAMGGRMSDIVSLQQFTTDIQAFMHCSEIRLRFFDAPYPVTTTLEVSSLYDARLLVEITAIAEIPTSRFIMPEAALEKHQ
ncbi:RidA family protein [uncultured Roseibium sp.]|uniref:RidA family protein n=1 Tax=uncultured Roseibium sp. TaxID=1936171 RepID=UPI002618C65E|nr:RidA family protein [uncultured Roseibium sp.]